MCHIYSHMLSFLISVLYRLPFPSACEWWMIQFSLSQLMKISWMLNIFFLIIVLFVVAIVWNLMHKSHVCFEKLWYDVVHPQESQHVPRGHIPECDSKKAYFIMNPKISMEHMENIVKNSHKLFDKFTTVFYWNNLKCIVRPRTFVLLCAMINPYYTKCHTFFIGKGWISWW